MYRQNRFEGNLLGGGMHRDHSACKIKEIYIQNQADNDNTKPLQISMSKTIKELKKEIEKLFGLKYSLNDFALRVKISGSKNGKLIQEEDENKTLFEHHFKSECTVIFGKEKNSGGFNYIIMK